MFQKYFVIGLKAFVPIVVTFAVVIWVFTNIEAFFGQILLYFIPMEYYFDGLGILVGIVFVFVIGILVNAWMLNKLYQLADGIVKKIPFIKTIYSSVQDLFDFFERTQDTHHNQAVLIRMGKMNLMGFITRENFEGLPKELGGPKDVLVYLPMSYMIGGIMVSIPRKLVTPIDMKVNQAMSMILTAGMTGGPQGLETEQKVADKA